MDGTTKQWAPAPLWWGAFVWELGWERKPPWLPIALSCPILLTPQGLNIWKNNRHCPPPMITEVYCGEKTYSCWGRKKRWYRKNWKRYRKFRLFSISQFLGTLRLNILSPSHSSPSVCLFKPQFWSQSHSCSQAQGLLPSLLDGHQSQAQEQWPSPQSNLDMGKLTVWLNSPAREPHNGWLWSK